MLRQWNKPQVIVVARGQVHNRAWKATNRSNMCTNIVEIDSACPVCQLPEVPCEIRSRSKVCLQRGLGSIEVSRVHSPGTLRGNSEGTSFDVVISTNEKRRTDILAHGARIEQIAALKDWHNPLHLLSFQWVLICLAQTLPPRSLAHATSEVGPNMQDFMEFRRTCEKWSDPAVFCKELNYNILLSCST